MHSIQLGKFAPAIVIIGSHAASATIDRSTIGTISADPTESRLLTAMFLHE
ncbi:MAG: hypothetical protein ACLQAT_31105 [Candidatus Binataceae bacterium]